MNTAARAVILGLAVGKFSGSAVAPAIADDEPCYKLVATQSFVTISAKICNLPPIDEELAKQDKLAICGNRETETLKKMGYVAGIEAIKSRMQEKGGKVTFCAWFKEAWGSFLTK
jgi:hypothetical protein